ncbi:MAG TPA: hypothetical protein VKZ53_17195 [Candidatus Angelobacter sp.]|nr:hypothetical protein [Candidatus Angelobacter sp.]
MEKNDFDYSTPVIARPKEGWVLRDPRSAERVTEKTPLRSLAHVSFEIGGSKPETVLLSIDKPVVRELYQRLK